MRVLPAFNETEGAIKPSAIAVAPSAFQAIDDAIGLAWRALEPVTQFRGGINALGDQQKTLQRMEGLVFAKEANERQ